MNKTTKARARRRPFPYARVARLWENGRTIAEIAKKVGRVDKGTDPYHTLRNFLWRMHRGYRDVKGNIVRLPYRVPRKGVRSAKASSKPAES